MTEATGADPTETITAAAELAENMAEAQKLAQEAWSLYLSRKPDDEAPDADPFNIMPALVELQKQLVGHPETVVESAIDLWSKQAMLWTNSIAQMAGVETKPIKGLENEHMDRRFKDEAWQSNAVTTYMKQSYLLASDSLRETIHKTDAELPEQDRDKLEFFTDRFVEAMSPANVFALNPQVMKATADEKGANIVRGMKQMVRDMKRGGGDLVISQTDMDAFEVGRNIAVTPGKVIFQNDLIQLIQYTPTTDKVYSRPLMIVPPWINKFYIMDLNEKKSLIRWLVAQGYTVFVISWRNPEPNGIERDFEGYMNDGFYEALGAVIEETGEKKVNVAGYCIGGTLTFCSLAHMAAKGDKRVNSATFFTAQADFKKAGDLKVFIDDKTLKQMEADGKKHGGVISAQQMAQAFNMMRSNELIWNYVINNYYLGKEPPAFDLLYWNADSTRMPAKCHVNYLRDFYRNNALAEGKLTMGGVKLDLSAIETPAYAICAREDHIAPSESVYRGMKEYGGPVRLVIGGSGHIAGIINPPNPDKPKYQYWINDAAKSEWPDTAGEWLEGAEETPGSWWPNWHQWLARKSGKKIKPRDPGAKLGVIEDAPGAYVKSRSDEA